MTPARFRWGLILITIGVLVIMAKSDLIAADFWIVSFLTLIALFLITVGIEKIFAHTRLKFISYLSSVLFVATIFILIVTSGAYRSDSSFFNSQTIREPLSPSVSVIHTLIELGNEDLTIREATKDAVWARFDEYTVKPDFKYSVDGDMAEVKLNPKGWWFGGKVRVDDGEINEWNLRFSESAPLELKVTGEDSEISMNFSENPLRSLYIDADNSNIYVRLGELLPEVNVEVYGRRSRLKLRIPRDSGLKVSGLQDAEYLKRVGLVKDGGYYITEDYETRPNRIQLDLDEDYNSLSIDYY